MLTKLCKGVIFSLILTDFFPVSMASMEEPASENLILMTLLTVASMESYYAETTQGNGSEALPLWQKYYGDVPLYDDEETITKLAVSPLYNNKTDYLSELSKLHDGLLDGTCEIIPVFMMTGGTTDNPGTNPPGNIETEGDTVISISPPSSPPNEQTPLTESSKIQKLYGIFGGGGGGGDGDGDGGYTSTEEEEDENAVKKRLNNLKKQVSLYNKIGFRCNRESCRLFQFRSQYSLFKTLERFASHHPAYAIDAYKLAIQLPFVPAIRLAIAAPVIYGISVDFGNASFHDLAIAIPRAFISALRMMFKTIVPLVVGKGADLLSLWGGIIITSVTDNAFAHLDHSNYSLPWGSEESADFALRVIATTWINYMWLKPYKSVIVPLLARPLAYLPAKAHHQFIHLTVDVASTTFLSYLAIALQIAGYPYLSLTVGPNPFGPAGVYPYPYCSPEVKWIFWGALCRAHSNNTLIEGE